MTARKQPGFERLPSRPARSAGSAASGPHAAAGSAASGQPATSIASAPPDADGRRALFSTAEQPPTIGTVTIACSGCEERTVVSMLRAVRLAVPSVHLPFVRPAPWSWMRCPACGRMRWVDVSVRI